MEQAIFSNTDLSKANFNTAYNITLNPEQNKLTSASFDLKSLPGLLTNHKIKVVGS
jgi:hypothetical protein